MAGSLWYLWNQFDFARYAATGFFWNHTAGTVTTSGTTSNPTIRFVSIDGLSHSFSEDYALLCGGGRRLCFVRTFHQGEVFPVVYDPAKPERAFIHDWALFSNIIEWLLILGCTALLPLIFVVNRLRTYFPVGQIRTENEQMNDRDNS
jgi:hypothetical protein